MELYIVNPDGTEKWRLREEYENENISGGPAIGNDGTLYIGVTSEKLIAINTDCGGVANSPWPMSMHDARHTGRQSY